MIHPNEKCEETEEKLLDLKASVSEPMHSTNHSFTNDLGMFFRAWLSAPLRTGATAPSSRALSEMMVHATAPTPLSRIIELGPGTGVVTQALLEAGVQEENLMLIELNPDFRDLLRNKFPRAEIIAEDAFSATARLAEMKIGKISSIVSSLPLFVYSRQKRIQLRENAMRLIGPFGRLVQFTYGPISPVPLHPSMRAFCSRRIWGNLPPAVVWSYQAHLGQQTSTNDLNS